MIARVRPPEHSPGKGLCLSLIHTGRAQRSLVSLNHSMTQLPTTPAFRRVAPRAVRALEED